MAAQVERGPPIVSIDSSRLLLEQYYCALRAKRVSRRAEHILHEVRGRLRALQWLHDRLLRLDHELENAARKELPPNKPNPNRMIVVFTDAHRPDCGQYTHAHVAPGQFDELRTLLEAFYYSANRIVDVLNDGRADLPGMPKFVAAGVRDVRNHLIEHPNRKSGVLVFSVRAGGPVGPQLKPLRWSLDPPGTEDRGFHANFAEFSDALKRALERALATCTRPSA
jgi:hypothetical protein